MDKVCIGSNRMLTRGRRRYRIHSDDDSFLIVPKEYVLMQDALQEAWMKIPTLMGAKIASEQVTTVRVKRSVHGYVGNVTENSAPRVKVS